MQKKKWELLPFQFLDSLISFFPSCACWVSSTMLYSSSKSWHLCLMPSLKCNASTVLVLRIMFAVGFHTV